MSVVDRILKEQKIGKYRQITGIGFFVTLFIILVITLVIFKFVPLYTGIERVKKIVPATLIVCAIYITFVVLCEKIMKINMKDQLEYLKEKRKEPVLKYFRDGRKCGTEGEFDLAGEQFKKILEINKFDYSAQRYLKIIEDLKKGLINKEYAVQLFKGEDYLTGKQYKEAILELEQAIKINPNYVEGYMPLGTAYSLIGKSQQGMSFQQKALQMEPDNVGPYVGLVGDYISSKQYQQAIDYCNKATKINSNFAISYYYLGYIYGCLEDYQEAISYYKKSLQLDPYHAPAYESMGYSYFQLHRYREAISSYKRAIELDPNNSKCYSGLGAAYFAVKKYRLAISILKKAIELNPQDKTAHEILDSINK